MGKDHKERVTAALNKYLEKQLPKPVKDYRGPNAKPEKEVEKACLEWMRSRGWTVDIYEAKATYNPAAGRYVSAAMKAGTCDCMGSTEDGLMIAVEFKAPGRLSTFNSEARYRQRQFIVDKINSNCFACVTDSVQRLEDILTQWMKIKSQDLGAARAYLISMLPREKSKPEDDEPLF